ncbi:MAG: hypothetical protein ACTS22_08055 [Phycisphaerales bacterium]
MPGPKPILRCRRCGHDLADLISAPWVHRCPECGTPFDRDFFYEGSPKERPEPNILPPESPRPGESGESDHTRERGA